MADEVNDAGPHRRFREGRVDRLRETLEAIRRPAGVCMQTPRGDHRNEDVLDPAIAKLGHHREPELGAFVFRDLSADRRMRAFAERPEAQNLAPPVAGDAEGEIRRRSPLGSNQWRRNGSLLTMRLSLSLIFTRKASKMTMG